MDIVSSGYLEHSILFALRLSINDAMIISQLITDFLCFISMVSFGDFHFAGNS